MLLLRETSINNEQATQKEIKNKYDFVGDFQPVDGAAMSGSQMSKRQAKWTIFLPQLPSIVYGGQGPHPASWAGGDLLQPLVRLQNYYRNGQDSMGWHQDNEPELGEHPVIASVNLGATRRFQLRHKKRKDLTTVSIDLEHGSLLLMQGTTQEFWKHQVPKTAQPIGARINLTFRFIRQSRNETTESTERTESF